MKEYTYRVSFHDDPMPMYVTGFDVATVAMALTKKGYDVYQVETVTIPSVYMVLPHA